MVEDKNVDNKHDDPRYEKKGGEDGDGGGREDR